MPDNSTNTGKQTAAQDDEAAGRNRRRELRLQCDPANVVLDRTGRHEPVDGQIVEVSKSGLQLRLETSVPAGEAVRVTRASMIINGQIRYCRPNEAGSFDTGVEIFDVQYTH
jgi:hypothetical protein